MLVFVAFTLFVGELFDRCVGCEAEGAGAHEVDVGVNVVGRPRGVAVKMLAGRTRHQFGLRLILVADLT